MNHRQWKKKYKKIHGVNPPKEPKLDYKTLSDILDGLRDATSEAMIMISETIKQFAKAAAETVDYLKTAPDEEFERFCEKLTPEQRAMAISFRGKHKNSAES